MMIIAFDAHYTKELVSLWQRCQLTVPWNNPYQDIERKMNHSPDKFLLGLLDGKVIASVMYDYDGHRGSVAYLGVEPSLQRQGFGQQIMQEVEQRLHHLGCPKLNLMVRGSNTKVVAFYQNLGYVQDDVVCLGKRLQEADCQYETSDA